MHICIWGFLPSCSWLPLHQPFTLSCPLLLTLELGPPTGKRAVRQNSPACRPVVWGGKAMHCAAWEWSSGTRHLAGAHGCQPQPSPQPPSQHSIPPGRQELTTYKHKQQNVLHRGQKNHHSLYAETFTYYIFQENISPSQDKSNYVCKTSSIKK